MNAALDGLKVVDFTAFASGPVATMLLGDFGAEVVKVEPLQGEGSRKWGATRCGPERDMSALFAALNRNKRGVAIDLKHEGGRRIAHRLIAQADVVIENMIPGAAARLGIDYETCARINPKLVYCSISGFGHAGPLRDEPGYDAAMQAYAGMASITGEPGRPSVRIGPSTVDFLTGAHAAFGILAALRHRDATGQGQQVSLSLYHSALHLMTHWMVDYCESGAMQPKCGPYFPFLTPSGNFLASDGEFHVSVSAGAMWSRFCELVGRPELEHDPRFADNAERCRNRDDLYALLVPIFRGQPLAHWIAGCRARGIVAAPVANVQEVLQQEQAHAIDMILPIESVPGRQVASAGVPLHMSRTPGGLARTAPTLGRDSAEVLEELGFSSAEIGSLRAAGVVR